MFSDVVSPILFSAGIYSGVFGTPAGTADLASTSSTHHVLDGFCHS